MDDSDKIFPDIIVDDYLDFEITSYVPKIINILEKHGIHFSYSHSDEEDFSSFIISFPSQKGVIEVNVSTVDEAKMLLGSNFHECMLLQNYEGLYNEQQKFIECIVKVPTPAFPGSLIKRFSTISLTNPLDSNVSIEISKNSKELSALSGNNNPRLSIKIKGINLGNSDPADILEKYSSSLFFQFDLINDRDFSLVRRRSTLRRAKRVGTKRVEFPAIEIEKGPMALYWHARDAAQLPMFQFLAYYQSVEYFFPRLSRQAAHKKLQSLLKDPTFRATSDSDIEKIFSTIRLTNTGRLGDEKSQLLAVINECILPEEIYDFINSSADRVSHFSETKKSATSKTKISLNDLKGIIGTTANRLYDIRCKVVHTKNEELDSQADMLLPNSPESDQLKLDIELMRFIAQKVLIYTSTRLY